MLRADVLLLLGTAVVLAAASPARMFSPGLRRNSAHRDPVVTVDCSNREAVEFVAKTHANFRCVYPNRRRGSGAIDSDPSADSLFNAPETPSSAPLFPAGLQSASLVRAKPTKCKPGTMFSVDVGACLEYNKPRRRIAPLRSDNLVVEEPKLEISAFASGPSSANDCRDDEVYSPDIGICMPVQPNKGRKKVLTTGNLVRENQDSRSLEIEAFPSSSKTYSDCKKNQVYVMDLSICVDIDVRPPPPFESASFIRTKAETPVGRVISSSDINPCPEGEVYVSEIDTCIPHTPPRRVKPLVSDSLVRPTTKATPVATREETNCGPDETFVPSIGICQPMVKPNVKPTPPSSSSLVKDEESLGIIAFENTKTASDCPPDAFFVPGLDLCLTP